VVAFVGTFDLRKGAREFPEIVRQVGKVIPDVRFKLLGVKGQLETAEQVRNAFPISLQGGLQIYPVFPADELPRLLADCSIGMFPSHIEGFGFGVLEMLAAGMPVIAYDAPGPPMMLPAEWLVRRGDASGLAAKLLAMLQNPAALIEARLAARAIAGRFTWANAARLTDDAYRQGIIKRRASQP
jgi:glycosyltransferase involved in cell wall biosynthesis